MKHACSEVSYRHSLFSPLYCATPVHSSWAHTLRKPCTWYALKHTHKYTHHMHMYAYTHTHNHPQTPPPPPPPTHPPPPPPPPPPPTHTHLCLWSNEEQVEAEDVGWNTTLLCVVPKHTHTTTLGELAFLVVQVLCSTHTCTHTHTHTTHTHTHTHTHTCVHTRGGSHKMQLE